MPSGHIEVGCKMYMRATTVWTVCLFYLFAGRMFLGIKTWLRHIKYILRKYTFKNFLHHNWLTLKIVQFYKSIEHSCSLMAIQFGWFWRNLKIPKTCVDITLILHAIGEVWSRYKVLIFLTISNAKDFFLMMDRVGNR